MRISRMTAGSTKAVAVDSPSSSNAKTKEMTADARRMMTSLSLNCSRTSSHSGVPFSSGISATISSPTRGRNSQSSMRSLWYERCGHVAACVLNSLTVATILLPVCRHLLLRETLTCVQNAKVRQNLAPRLGMGILHSCSSLVASVQNMSVLLLACSRLATCWPVRTGKSHVCVQIFVGRWLWLWTTRIPAENGQK